MADIIRFSKKAEKYRSDAKEMVFLESGFDNEINNIIISRYDQICKAFKESGLYFIYLPFLYNELIATKCAQYFHPSLTDGGKQQISALNSSSYYKYLAGSQPLRLLPSILIYIDSDYKNDIYMSIPVNTGTLDDIKSLIEEYKKAKISYFEEKCTRRHGLVPEEPDNGIRFSLRSPDEDKFSFEGKKIDDFPFPDNPFDSEEKKSRAPKPRASYDDGVRYSLRSSADDSRLSLDKVFEERANLELKWDDFYTLADKSWEFDTDTDRLYRELSSVVGDYVKRGLPLAILEKIIKEHTQISKMEIGENFEVRLTDYNMEIPFDSMERSLYILFLNHPNGINFFDLPGHRKELESIYRTVTTRRNEEAIMRTLNTVTDPMHDTSINSYVSRIKKKLMTLMNPYRAQLYFITGKKGSEKYIPFAREHSDMIEWL